MSCVGIMIFYRAPHDDDKMNVLIHFKIVTLGPWKSKGIFLYLKVLALIFGAIICGTNSFEPKCKFSSVEQIEENSFATNYLLQKNVNIH